MPETEPGTGEAPSKQRAMLALAPGLVVFSMGQTALFAVAGPVFRDIGFSEFQLGIIISASALVFVLASPVWGRLADRLGRKRVTIIGLGAYAVTSAGFACAMDLGLQGVLGTGTVFALLLAIRLAYAALGAGIQPAAVAVMADLSTGEDRSSAVAIVGAAFGLGMILGPAAAALLVGFGPLVPLYAIAGLGGLAVFNTLFLLWEPSRQQATSNTDRSLVPLRPLLPIMAASLFLFTAVSALQQTMAFFVQDFLGAGTAEAARATGYCFIAMAAATLFAQGGLIQWLKPGPAPLLKLGIPLLLIGVAVYATAPSFPILVGATVLLGLGFGLANPGFVAAASLTVGSDRQGETAGLMQSMMAGGYIVGPLAGTALYGRGPDPANTFIAGMLLLAFLTVVRLRFAKPTLHREDPA